MKDKKLQVFVSSTYIDLIEERQAAVEAILSSGNIPAGMELFSAGDESQMTVIERWIDESDIYLLILGGRYGSIDKKTGKSYTQLEFEYALQQGKPLFAVVISESALENKIKHLGITAIEQERPHELKKFRIIVLSNLVRFWDDKKDIKIAIHETLSDFSYRKELKGWIRGDNSVNTGALAEEIARLTKENSELRSKITTSEVTKSILYSGLTYERLQELLLQEMVAFDAKKNLFEYLMSIGDNLSIGYKSSQYSEAEEPILNKLIKFKLARMSYKDNNYYPTYEFSDDGHNFYLAALASYIEDRD